MVLDALTFSLIKYISRVSVAVLKYLSIVAIEKGAFWLFLTTFCQLTTNLLYFYKDSFSI